MFFIFLNLSFIVLQNEFNHPCIINSNLKSIFSCLIKKQEKMRIGVKLILIFSQSFEFNTILYSYKKSFFMCTDIALFTNSFGLTQFHCEKAITIVLKIPSTSTKISIILSYQQYPPKPPASYSTRPQSIFRRYQ
jgi:hypothetical protein